MLLWSSHSYLYSLTGWLLGSYLLQSHKCQDKVHLTTKCWWMHGVSIKSGGGCHTHSPWYWLVKESCVYCTIDAYKPHLGHIRCVNKRRKHLLVVAMEQLCLTIQISNLQVPWPSFKNELQWWCIQQCNKTQERKLNSEFFYIG